MDEWEIMMDHRSADLEPRPIKERDVIKERLFTGPWMKVLSKTRIMENLYFVAIGIRESSMFHPEDINEIVHTRMAAGSVGLGMKVRKAGKRVHKVFIYSDPKKKMAELIPDSDESMGEREFIIAQITMANFSGAFLEFPKCCIDSFVTHLMNATDQDAQATEALLSYPDPDPRAYFYERFIPCEPGCRNALAMGERIEQLVAEEDPDILLDYLELREEHMEEVRSGAIVREKIERNKVLDSNN